MSCPRCGDPYAPGLCSTCKHEEKQGDLRERGERITGHGIYDDPGPCGDYYEGENEGENDEA